MEKIRKATPGSPGDDRTPSVGTWHWLRVLAYTKRGEEEQEVLGCVVHVGTNYAKLVSVGGSRYRVHLDEFEKETRPELDADGVISERLASISRETAELMARIAEITARLSIAPGQAGLPSGSETKALATLGPADGDFRSYGKELVRAKDKDLPDLFKRVEELHEEMATWMKANLIPMQAQVEAGKKSIGAIEDRIFSVELYAGLTERVAQLSKGDPAPPAEKLRLFQRRLYMDEESLVEYRAGGMEFKHLKAFDRWIARRENRDRILPFPRCLVAFRVRRERKDRHDDSFDLASFIKMWDRQEADERTFLYVRNGDQLFRIATSIDFGEKLFPDMEDRSLAGKLWAKREFSKMHIITDREYQDLVERDAKKHLEWRQAMAERRQLKKAKKKVPSAGPWNWEPTPKAATYRPFDQTNVYYDDIAEDLAGRMKRHNRLVLVLQGLLDRSPVLHPHPPWQLWSDEGFQAGLDLIYDDSKALAPAQRPDLEAYLKRLNASITAGTVTVGQQDLWLLREGEKEARRMDEDHRHRGTWRPARHQPIGDNGPGLVARVKKATRTRVTYEWLRERRTISFYEQDPVRTRFTTGKERILNVDAYEPGDYRQFFEDPRTRQEYLRWAPLLLLAEDFLAGALEVRDPEDPDSG